MCSPDWGTAVGTIAIRKIGEVWIKSPIVGIGVGGKVGTGGEASVGKPFRVFEGATEERSFFLASCFRKVTTVDGETAPNA